MKPRVSLDEEAMVEHANEWVPCRTVDLAAKGMALRCNLEPPMGQVVRLKFFLPDGTGWVNVSATLVRGDRRGDEFVWGLKFERLDNWTVSHIERFIRDRLATAARERITSKAPALRNAYKPESSIRGLFRAAPDEIRGGKPKKK